MTTNDKLVGVLNDLIQINNDRINGYEKAIEEIKDRDVDLNGIFSKLANDSRKYAAELSREVIRLGGDPDTGTTNSGKLYRVWMDIKSGITARDRKSVLALCEFGEAVQSRAGRGMERGIRAWIEKGQNSLRRQNCAS